MERINRKGVCGSNEVEICEYINEKGVVTRKTANGIDLPLSDTNLPTYCIIKSYMTREEIKNIYGKDIK